MREEKRIFMRLLFLVLLVTVGILTAQSYREDMEANSLDTAKKILKLAEDKKFTEAAEEMKKIDKVFTSIKDGFKVDLKKELSDALTAEDAALVKKLIQKFAYYDMRDIFTSIVTEGKDKSKSVVKQWHKGAYRAYIYLAPELAKKKVAATKDRKEETGKAIDSRIRKIFRNAYMALGKKSPYSRRESKPDFKAYKRYADAIAAEVLRVFPDYAPAEADDADDEKGDKDKGKEG